MALSLQSCASYQEGISYTFMLVFLTEIAVASSSPGHSHQPTRGKKKKKIYLLGIL